MKNHQANDNVSEFNLNNESLHKKGIIKKVMPAGFKQLVVSALLRLDALYLLILWLVLNTATAVWQWLHVFLSMPQAPLGDEYYQLSLSLEQAALQLISLNSMMSVATVLINLVFLLLVALLLKRSTLLFSLTRRASNKLVVIADAMLAEDMADLHPTCFVYGISASIQQNLRRLKTIPLNILQLQRLDLTSAVVVVNQQHDLQNVDVLETMLTNNGAEQARFFVNVDSLLLRDAVRHRIDHPNLVLGSQLDWQVRYQLRHCPAHKVRDLRADTQHILIIGWNAASLQLVGDLLRRLHYPGHIENLEFTILTDNVQQAQSEAGEAFSNLPDNIAFRFLHANLTQPISTQTLVNVNSHQIASCCYISLDDAGDAVAQAQQLQNHWRLLAAPIVPIHVLSAHAVPVAFAHRQASKGIHLPPPSATMLTQMITQRDELDKLAMSIHQGYIDHCLAKGETVGSRAALQLWDNLDEFLKEDNRAFADHQYIKFDFMGWLLENGDAPGAATFSRAQQLAMAKSEHSRWMFNRLLSGWQYSAKRDDNAKLHPDIRPWSTLTETQQTMNAEYLLGGIKNMQHAGMALSCLELSLPSEENENASAGKLSCAVYDLATNTSPSSDVGDYVLLVNTDDNAQIKRYNDNVDWQLNSRAVVFYQGQLAPEIATVWPFVETLQSEEGV